MMMMMIMMMMMTMMKKNLSIDTAARHPSFNVVFAIRCKDEIRRSQKQY
jgi:hypothetical protein